MLISDFVSVFLVEFPAWGHEQTTPGEKNLDKKVQATRLEPTSLPRLHIDTFRTWRQIEPWIHEQWTSAISVCSNSCTTSLDAARDLSLNEDAQTVDGHLGSYNTITYCKPYWIKMERERATVTVTPFLLYCSQLCSLTGECLNIHPLCRFNLVKVSSKLVMPKIWQACQTAISSSLIVSCILLADYWCSTYNDWLDSTRSSETPGNWISFFSLHLYKLILMGFMTL